MNSGRDRDRTLEQALKQTLRARVDVPSSVACLDAETLAAWMDDGLDPAAAALAEAHVSSCARCQTFVAAMARAAPDVPVGGHAGSSVWRWWLAPVAAAAAATVVWMVVPGQRVASPPPAPREEVAQAPQEPSTGFVTEPPPPASSVPSPPPPAVAPRLPSAPRSAAPGGVAARESAKPVDETIATEAAARSRTQSADAQERPAAPAPSTALRVELTAARDVPSPDPAVRWRIGANGVVEYTADGGRTWERASGVTTEIVAGSSPAPNVCWLVGHGGLVLVTSDGRTFARVSAPVEADLATVQASDARTAVVTAADGRAFLTDDGGRTWRSRE